jgi:DNA ligase-1
LSSASNKSSPKVAKGSPKVAKSSPKVAKSSPKVAKDDDTKPAKKMAPLFANVKSKANAGDQKASENEQKISTVKRSFGEALRDRRFHPIDDAPWKRDEPVPYLALSHTLAAIEETSGRLKTVEILANFFRSVMLLTPKDLLASVYLCLNKLAPAYAGVELGVGESLLMRAVANTTGRTLGQVKTDSQKTGDLGIVAEVSKSSQVMLCQPKPLTVPIVFERLKGIALMTGHSAMSMKVQKIQQMLVACKESEARFLIRSLGGELAKSFGS